MSNQNFTDKIAVPYAEALLDLSQNSNQILEATEDLSLISTYLLTSKELQLALSNPLISAEIKKTILRNLFAEKVNSFILNFLLVLVDRRRIFMLIKIIDKYMDLTYRLKSTTVVELYTAVSFNEDQQTNLIKKIKLLTNSKNIKLVMTIDPSLIGGFLVKIGSKVIDASVSGKLQQMSLHLNTNY